MKKIKILLFLFFVTTASYAGNNKSDNSFTYSFEFTGKVNNEADSVFNVYCVIEKGDLTEEAIYVKKGMRSEEKIAKSKTVKGMHYFLLGEASEDIASFEISKLKKDGNKEKISFKKK